MINLLTIAQMHGFSVEKQAGIIVDDKQKWRFLVKYEDKPVAGAWFFKDNTLSSMFHYTPLPNLAIRLLFNDLSPELIRLYEQSKAPNTAKQHLASVTGAIESILDSVVWTLSREVVAVGLIKSSMVDKTLVNPVGTNELKFLKLAPTSENVRVLKEMHPQFRVINEIVSCLEEDGTLIM